MDFFSKNSSSLTFSPSALPRALSQAILFSIFLAFSGLPFSSQSLIFSLLFLILSRAALGSAFFFSSFGAMSSLKSNFEKTTPFSVLTLGLATFTPKGSLAFTPSARASHFFLLEFFICFCFFMDFFSKNSSSLTFSPSALPRALSQAILFSIFLAFSGLPFSSQSLIFSLLFLILSRAALGSAFFFSSFGAMSSLKSNFEKTTPFSVLTLGLATFTPKGSTSLLITLLRLPAFLPMVISFCFISWSASFFFSMLANFLFNFFCLLLSKTPNFLPLSSSSRAWSLSLNSWLEAALLVPPGFILFSFSSFVSLPSWSSSNSSSSSSSFLWLGICMASRKETM